MHGQEPEPVGAPTPRARLLAAVARRVPVRPGDDCVRVAVDGVDGVGKTVFADELAAALRDDGREVVRISLDDFHNQRAVRHRRGRTSPEGFWLDSYNYGRLHADVLEPLGPGGDRWYRPAAHDLATDAVLRPPRRLAAAGSVLVLDGLFLHRDELAGAWDLSVWLAAAFHVTAARMAARDGTAPDPQHPAMRRYVEGQRIYLAACDPARRADIVIDNTELDDPRERQPR